MKTRVINNIELIQGKKYHFKNDKYNPYVYFGCTKDCGKNFETTYVFLDKEGIIAQFEDHTLFNRLENIIEGYALINEGTCYMSRIFEDIETAKSHFDPDLKLVLVHVSEIK